MSSNEVNLLRNKHQNSNVQRNYVTLIRLAAAICLFLVIATEITIFTLENLSPLADLQKKESALLHNLTVYHTKAIREYLISDRVKHIQAILKSRSEFDILMAKLFNVLPSDTTVSSLSLDQLGLSVTLTSTSLLSLGQSLDGFIALKNNKTIFKTIFIDGLVADERKGKFSLVIHGNFL